jgi:elongation factor G
MDKIGADFFNCVRMIKDRTGATPAPIALPIGAEDKLEGIIDLITMEEWTWKGEDLGASWTRQPIREELRELADEWHGKLVELAVEMDDTAMEAYLEGEEPTVEKLRELIRKGCLSMTFVPVTAGSAFKNKGVQPLLNAVIDFLPSPLDVPAYMGFAGRRDRDAQHPALGRRRAALLGPGLQDHERPLRGLAHLHAHLLGRPQEGRRDAQLDQGQERARGPHDDDARHQPRGDRRGLRGRHHRAGGPQGHHDRRHALLREGAVVLETMTFPQPVIEIAVEPKTKADQEKMGLAPRAPRGRGPVLPRRDGLESGQTIMKGMGELHLDILVDRMRREFKVEANIGAPQVAYRETISMPSSTPTRTRSRRAARASSPRSSSASSPPSRARATPSSRRSSAAWCPRSTSRASRRASSR